MKILKTYFENVVDAQAFWLQREAYKPKSGIRDKKWPEGDDSEDPLCECG